ncbi:hypothetical protein [Amycolatopsis sp. H20-H5]|uniref:hypothetical protein n=1 Tax=Amycolatopsis sp. H20-H5 TaxID=3046309 RepID=UPI002DBE17FE|nr:hypothetical protein [Amycolatopsis sp. H20-H5]MEC3978501.1 hypothetical protein [Amycolatopsis sp. H20-H5]
MTVPGGGGVMIVLTRPTRPSVLRRTLTLCYFVLPVLTVGILAFLPFIHAAFRLRRPGVWLSLAVYVVLDATIMVLFGLSDPTGGISDVYGNLAVASALLVMVVACVQLARLRRDVLSAPKVLNGVVNGVHCGLFSVDIANSGAVGHDSEAFVRLRRALFRTLEESFEASGIDWPSCVRQDTGDGMIVVVPPQFPKSLLLSPLLDNLAARLWHHNDAAGEGVRIRVRAAVHSGDVRIDEYGVTGRPKLVLARLLDAPPLRDALAGADPAAPLAVLVSDRFHDDVVDNGDPALDPLSYHPVLVEVKETEVRAWLHLPRFPRGDSTG